MSRSIKSTKRFADPSATSGASVNALNFGPQKRFVSRTPVGGIDNLDNWRAGWKVEDVFTLTDEQTKSLEGLRGEYKRGHRPDRRDVHSPERYLSYWRR